MQCQVMNLESVLKASTTGYLLWRKKRKDAYHRQSLSSLTMLLILQIQIPPFNSFHMPQKICCMPDVSNSIETAIAVDIFATALLSIAEGISGVPKKILNY